MLAVFNGLSSVSLLHEQSELEAQFRRSALPQATRRYISTWKQAFSNPKALSTAPLGAILAPAHEALNRIQNPTDCSTASFLLYSYSSSNGFGAVVKHLTTAFYTALRSGRIFVLDDTNQFYWAKGCLGGARFECFFLPLSRCSPTEIRRLVEIGKLRQIDVNRESTKDEVGVPVIPPVDPTQPSVVRFSIPMGKSKSLFYSLTNRNDSGDVLRSILEGTHIDDEQRPFLSPGRNAQRTLNTVLASYIVRLNHPTALRTGMTVAHVLNHYGILGNESSRVIGVPVRGSDKCYKNTIDKTGEMRCVKPSIALNYARRVAIANPSLTHALLTSESANTIKGNFKANDDEGQWVSLQVMRNFLDVPAGSGGRKKRRDKSMAELLAASLVTLHLQAFARFHVLTPRSTFHSLIIVTARSTPGKKEHSFFPLGDFSDLHKSMKSQLMRR